jgi:hypothetical protein
MPIQHWRLPETIERLKRLERPGFAAEFLRRNADYRNDYARMLRQTTSGTQSATARHWGLRFPP